MRKRASLMAFKRAWEHAKTKGVGENSFTKTGRASSAELLVGKGALRGMAIKKSISERKFQVLKETNARLSEAIKKKEIAPKHYKFVSLRSVYSGGHLFMEHPSSFSVADFASGYALISLEKKGFDIKKIGDRHGRATVGIIKKVGFTEGDVLNAVDELRANLMDAMGNNYYKIDDNASNILVRSYDRKTKKFVFTLIDL